MCVEYGTSMTTKPQELAVNQTPPPVPVVTIDPLTLRRTER
jgi:hypothetical protein